MEVHEKFKVLNARLLQKFGEKLPRDKESPFSLSTGNGPVNDA